MQAGAAARAAARAWQRPAVAPQRQRVRTRVGPPESRQRRRFLGWCCSAAAILIGTAVGIALASPGLAGDVGAWLAALRAGLVA